MGQPWFQCRDLEKTAGLIALSSNYALYGDMSNRMMTIAAEFAPRQEIYSIDESFLDFTGVLPDLVTIGRALRAKVLRYTGIPTCAGFGPTKTLAKLANHVAKTAERKPGSYPAAYSRVFSFGLATREERSAIFDVTPVDEVWGIGRRIGAKLNEGGIATVADLLKTDTPTLRRRFSVVLERTVLELKGVRTVELDDVPAPRQQIMCSRSFGRPVTSIEDMAEAVSSHATRVSEKARKDESLAGAVHVFAHTSPHRRQDKQYSASVTVPLVRPTADTRIIAGAALNGLRAIYRQGYRYEKAGVMLVELQPDTLRQSELNLIDDEAEPLLAASRDRTKLMSAVDILNSRYGRGSVQLGSSKSATAEHAWSMKADRRTPRYTTVWEEMATARA
jgi:DNA polymerase V